MKARPAASYRDDIAHLNPRNWAALGRFVDDDAIHNGRRLGLSGHRAMLERNVTEIPDLRFDVRMILVDPPYIASQTIEVWSVIDKPAIEPRLLG